MRPVTCPLYALFAVLTVSMGAAQSSARLPELVSTALTAQYPGWRLAEMTTEIAESWRTAYPGRPPNILQADDDGNGLSDYAVLIDYSTQAAGGRPRRFNRALVFLRTATGFRPTPLTQAVEFYEHDGLHLWPVLKGAKGWDLITEREFTYERDAIAVLFDSKGPCTTFVYRGGKFVSIWTCD